MAANVLTLSRIEINGVDYPGPEVTIVMNSDKNVKAIYEEKSMGTVVFSGNVSAQAAEGETVTITITKPDGIEVTITEITDSTGAFSSSYTDFPGSYTAIATIQEDALYKATSSPVVAFDIEKGDRTLTLSVA